MCGKKFTGFLGLLLISTLVLARPPKEIPSSLTLAGTEAYLSGDPQWEILPAETYGYPDPRRVLSLEKQLALTEEQLKKIRPWANRIHEETALLGKKIVGEELLLDHYFRKGETDYSALANRIESIGTLRWRLRLNVLRAYTNTRNFLNDEQLKKYRELKSLSMEEKSPK